MEEKTVSKTHKVLLQNRKSGSFSGIVDVLSFDVAEILLETELGMLLIKGNDLHVNRLSLEKGKWTWKAGSTVSHIRRSTVTQSRESHFWGVFLNDGQ